MYIIISHITLSVKILQRKPKTSYNLKHKKFSKTTYIKNGGSKWF